MSSYANYRGRTYGRIIHFLHHYRPYHIAEHATLGNNQVYYEGKKIADIKWSEKFGEKDVPEFTFFGENAELMNWNQEQKRQEAIDESVNYFSYSFYDELKECEEVSGKAILAMQPKAYRDACFWASVDQEGGKPSFLVAKNGRVYPSETSLYFETFKKRYIWNKELNDWLLDAKDEK